MSQACAFCSRGFRDFERHGDVSTTKRRGPNGFDSFLLSLETPFAFRHLQYYEALRRAQYLRDVANFHAKN